MTGTNWMGGKRNLAKSRSKDITGRVQKGHFGKLRHEILSKDMGKSKTLLQQPSHKSSFPRFDLAHANQPDAPTQGGRNTSDFVRTFRPNREFSTWSSSDSDRRTKTRSSKVLRALAQNSQGDRSAIDCVLNMPDLVGISSKPRQAQGTSMYASSYREVTPAAFNPGRQESEAPSALPSTPSPAENIRGAVGPTHSVLQQPLTRRPSDTPESCYPTSPTKPALWLHDGNLPPSLESYTTGMENTAWLPADLMDYDSTLSEYGTSDVGLDYLDAYKPTEPPVSSQCLGRFFSYNGSPPRTPRKGPLRLESPATSNIILEFSSPARSQFHSTESTLVSPYIFKGQTVAGTSQSPLVSSPSSVPPTFGSSESPRAFGAPSGDYVPLGTFLEDPYPWNAIGLFLGLPALVRETDQTSALPSSSRHGSAASSRAGVGWEAEEQTLADIEMDIPDSSFSASGPHVETALELAENASCTSESPLTFALRDLPPMDVSDSCGRRLSESPGAKIEHEEISQPTPARETSSARSRSLPGTSLVTPAQSQASSVAPSEPASIYDLQGPSLFSDGPGSEESGDEAFIS